MIESKADLRAYLRADMAFYHDYSKKDQMLLMLVADPAYKIFRYLRCLRKEEYYHNVRKDILGRLMELYWFRRKNILGNRLGFKIPRNCFGPGLTIYHHGEVIVNEKVRVGVNCRLHGGNCIGNSGAEDKVPCIGDDLDLGIGAKIIGGVTLGNAVVVGAGAVVTKTFDEDDIVLVGIPARKLK